MIHGFGFANVLLDLGLPNRALVAALGGFNIGVELGQLAIVLVFFPFAWLRRRTLFYRWVDLSKKYELPPVSSVNQFFNVKKQTLEQAFGFEKKPWNSRYNKTDKLLNDDGYRFIGEKNGQSSPAILEATKEIFSSKKNSLKHLGSNTQLLQLKLCEGCQQMRFQENGIILL